MGKIIFFILEIKMTKNLSLVRDLNYHEKRFFLGLGDGLCDVLLRNVGQVLGRNVNILLMRFRVNKMLYNVK